MTAKKDKINAAVRAEFRYPDLSPFGFKISAAKFFETLPIKTFYQLERPLFIDLAVIIRNFRRFAIGFPVRESRRWQSLMKSFPNRKPGRRIEGLTFK